jgi:uncharacterized protein RhaS with RHS repeats
LYYLQSRYYNPEWGRFISADNMMPRPGGDAVGNNLFAYSNNNPVNNCDPSGQFPISLAALGSIVVAAIGAVIGGIVAHNTAKDNGAAG